LATRGERVVGTDELTGVQALERKHPDLPLAPGTRSSGANSSTSPPRHPRVHPQSRDVLSGHVIAPSCGPTRTEADFLAHVRGVIATDPGATRWHFVADNLDIHRSESLVRWVAAESGLEVELGKKGKRGILENRRSRAAFS
jgi:DDE superfamily endonuclease